MSKLREKLKFFFTSEKINIYIYTCSQLVSFLLAFLINLFFTKFANPTGYGEYKYATNFLLTVPTFFAFGIPFCCSRLIAKDNADEKHKVLTAGLYVTSALSVIVSVVLYISLFFGEFETLNHIKVVFPFIIIFAIRNLFMSNFLSFLNQSPPGPSRPCGCGCIRPSAARRSCRRRCRPCARRR